MGNFYTNVILPRADLEPVRSWLEADHRVAFVLAHGGSVAVFDRQAEQQDGSNQVLAQRLSSEFGAALGTLVHDDDLLEFHVFEQGTLIDQYSSWPEYHDDDDDKPAPAGGNPAVLTRIAAAGDPSAVEEILREDYLFEYERHEKLLSALGLPADSAGLGFNYIARGDAKGIDLSRVGQ